MLKNNYPKVNKFVNLKNAREKEQLKVMKKIAKDQICPFCENSIKNYHPKPILFKTANWLVTENAWPYPMTQNHFLLIHRKHIVHTKNISAKGWSEIGKIIKKLEKSNNLNYGTLLMRFGETSKTGASVTHVHFQLVQSNPNDKNYDPKIGIFTRIG